MSKLKQLLVSVWHRFEDLCTLESDSETERRRKVTLVVIVLLSCLEGVASIINGFIQDTPVRHRLIPLGYVVIVGSGLVAFLITKRLRLLLYPFLLMILVTPVFFHCLAGGFSPPGVTPIIIWSLLAPFGALMFCGIRNSLWWFLAYLLLVFAALSSDTYWMRFAGAAEHGGIIISQGIAIIGLSITIFATMLYFVNAFQREHTRAENALLDLKETQATLIHSEKMASLGKLAASLSHEMNTPVGALKSATDSIGKSAAKIQTEMGNDRALENRGGRTSLQNMWTVFHNSQAVAAEACNRISGLMDHFRTFIRLDESEFQRTDIHEGLDSTLALMEPEFAERIALIKDYGDIPPIRCFPGELNQVFMNILSNAVCAIEGEGSITVESDLHDDMVRIRISDTGRGIPEENLGALFEPTFTKEGQRVKAGLGLFISDNIIRKHQGRISVKSEPGKGSTFTILLPSGS